MKKFILTAALLLGFTQFARAELLVPTININPDVYYPVDEILYIEGRAAPNMTIEIQFRKEGSKSVLLVSHADQNGEWVLAQKTPLDAGDWEARARVATTDATSAWSNPRIIRVVITGVVIGGITLKFNILLFLVFASGGLVLYLFFRLKKETRAKTEALIGRDLSDFRRDVVDELKHVGGGGRGRQSFSPEEGEHRDKLLRELDSIEREIGRKLDQE